MNNIAVRQAHREDFESVARLIAEKNRNPETHCIHSDTGGEYQGIQREMNRLDSDSELCFVIALQDGRMIGTLGSEWDEGLGRGWIRGPFVVAGAKDWNTMVSALLQELLALLPPAIHRLDSFLNIANRRGNDFYFNHGFRQLGLVHVYVSDPPEKAAVPTSVGETLQPQQAREFIALHQTIFPQTYATGQGILDKLDDDHRVFVCSRQGELLGYLYATIEEGSGDGLVEFLGVRADARGRGIGRQLLQTALGWFFEIKQVSQATLVVDDDLMNARSLYEKVGFRLKYTGVHARREW